MKPQDMAKVAEAQAEFDHYDKVWENDFQKYRGSQILFFQERGRIKGSLDKELPELIKLLPIALRHG